MAHPTLASGSFMPSAHGVGGVKDLPIPLEYALAGGVAALVISFLVLGLAWKRPRYDATLEGSVGPGREIAWLGRIVTSTAYTLVMRLVGLALLGFVLLAAFGGKDLAINPIFAIVFVYVWFGLVPLSLFFGPVWRTLSPVRTIHAGLARLTGSDPDVGVAELPAWVGVWPGALLLGGFAWFELVDVSNGLLGPMRLFLGVYLALMVLGGSIFGSAFYAAADPFEVYSTLVSRMSIWSMDSGTLRVRSPLANLGATPYTPGLVGVVAALLGSTAFDSFSGSNRMVKLYNSTDMSLTLLKTLLLVGFICVVALLFWAASVLTGYPDGLRPGVQRARNATYLAVSVAPIVIGYAFAHYVTSLVEYGQTALPLLSDPLTRGDDWLGLADFRATYFLSNRPTLLAVLKVSGVVVGHVVAVVMSHDRSLSLLKPPALLIHQLAMLVVMVVFTVGGLMLLFSA